MSESIDIEYSITAWSKSLGIHHATLQTKLVKAGQPRDGQITARQIFEALHGEKDASVIRMNNAKAEKLERENKVRAGELVELPTVETQFWNGWLWPVRTQVEIMPEQLAPLLGGDEAQKILMRWATSTTEIYLKKSPFTQKPSE